MIITSVYDDSVHLDLNNAKCVHSDENMGIYIFDSKYSPDGNHRIFDEPDLQVINGDGYGKEIGEFYFMDGVAGAEILEVYYKTEE